MNNKLVLLIGVGLMFLSVFAYNTYSHESVHQAIFSYDGCRNVNVHYGLIGSYASCVGENYTESDVAALSHNFNEVIGYNVFALIFGLLLVCVTIILTSRMEE